MFLYMTSSLMSLGESASGSTRSLWYESSTLMAVLYSLRKWQDTANMTQNTFVCGLRFISCRRDSLNPL